MTANVVRLKVDEERVAGTLQQAQAKLAGDPVEIVLDFSSVCRIEPADLHAMQRLAEALNGTGNKVMLCGVNVRIYKVLKLMKLESRFSFQ